jgi:exonuclease III
MRARRLASPNFPPLSFLAQNCNSLNISTCCEKQLKKIAAITGFNKDIIFLSDIRLANKDAVDDIKQAFLYSRNSQYDFYYNSTKNSRGVGILINKKLNIVVRDILKDEQENILSLCITYDNVTFRCISVYGPNTNDDLFFINLGNILAQNQNIPTILGGDWNLTGSIMDSNLNIDIINMAHPPSIFRSRLLYNLCEEYSLVDPFRALHPDVRDYTYIPRAGTNNRSRLDFFLISSVMLNDVRTCNISEYLGSKLFDHKSINLDFSPAEFSKSRNVFSSTLKHPRFNSIVYFQLLRLTCNTRMPTLFREPGNR